MVCVDVSESQLRRCVTETLAAGNSEVREGRQKVPSQTNDRLLSYDRKCSNRQHAVVAGCSVACFLSLSSCTGCFHYE